MNMKELSGKTNHELQIVLKAKQHELRTLRFKAAAKELKDVREIRDVRKTIARILTLLTSKK